MEYVDVTGGDFPQAKELREAALGNLLHHRSGWTLKRHKVRLRGEYTSLDGVRNGRTWKASMVRDGETVVIHFRLQSAEAGVKFRVGANHPMVVAIGQALRADRAKRDQEGDTPALREAA